MGALGDAIVGVVANPLSGRDIRRLVTQASVFPTAEKANMIQRMLTALAAVVASGDRTASVELGPSLKMRRRANRA